ncbi:binding-protein-dependent transport system inner membrane protein [Spirochaetia bacterium]|nr:binding-protein-dependent transport system inner membrane protein [Spirochaetia bacterium]
MKYTVKKKAYNIVITVIGVIVMLIIAFPVLWLLRTALIPPVALYDKPPVLLFKPSFVSFGNAIWMGHLGSRLVNSIIISIFSTLISVFLGVMAGYGITRFRFPFMKNVHILVLFNRMVPAVATLLPIFIMFNRLRLIDTHIGLILAYSAGNMSMVIWMAWGFFRALPHEMEESAHIDGAGSFRVFVQIILPVSTPIVASVGILAFTGSWNEFMMATVLSRIKAGTLPPGVVAMMNQSNLAWDQLSAASVMASLPLVILCIVAQKYFIQGLTAGSVKG